MKHENMLFMQIVAPTLGELILGANPVAKPWGFQNRNPASISIPNARERSRGLSPAEYVRTQLYAHASTHLPTQHIQPLVYKGAYTPIIGNIYTSLYTF